MTKKEVLIITTSLNLGGSEIQSVRLANMLVKQNYSVRFLYLKRDEDIKSLLSSEVEVQGLNLVISKPRVLDYIKVVYNYIISVVAIQKSVNKSTVIISFLVHASITGFIISKLSGCKHIVSIRSDRFTKRKKQEVYFRKLIMKYICKSSTYIVFNSDKSLNKFNNDFKIQEKSLVIKNIITSGKVLFDEKKFSNKKLRGMYVGRFDNLKNLENLILSTKNQLRNNVKIDFFGEGRNRLNYKKIIDENNLKNIISIEGLSLDIISNSKEYDFLILTSFHEGLPNVVIEAMNNYLPVISTRVGEVTRLLDNSRGLFIDGFSEIDIETAILDFQHLPLDIKKNMIIKSKEYIDQEFSNDVVFQNWETLIKSL